jgi:signal transduction histidine kinase
MIRLWPRSLFMRLALAWCGALFLAHIINVGIGFLHLTDFQNTRTSYYLAKDLQILVPQLEAADTAGRAGWLRKMARKDYDYEIETAAPGAAMAATASAFHLVQEIYGALGPRYPVNASPAQAPREEVRLHVPLASGGVLTVHLFRNSMVLPLWGGLIFMLQVAAVGMFTWLAVRQATRPLVRLVEAAETLGASMQCEPIAEEGPVEVSRVAAAFNLMGRRIKDHLAERVRILAAISHDLQTPITRMRLRADLMDSAELRAKFQSDLDSMQVLVEEGIAYARSADRATEPLCAVDIGAMLDALVCDYTDAGHAVRLSGASEMMVVTRPHTLRRIVVNLTDNALKFGEQVEIAMEREQPGMLAICVRDRGPGIAPEELAAVFQPFYRVESSRNRSTGGTGLGLAIAQQLSLALGANLVLANREGGGLEARLELKV